MGTSWREPFQVRSFDLDARGRMTLPALIRQMQNAADGHARAHGLAVDQLLQTGRTWVLREFHVEQRRELVQEDRGTVCTWATTRCAGARAWRDFRVDATGDTAAVGSSLWLMLDTERWRPIRVTPDVLAVVDADREAVLEPGTVSTRRECEQRGKEFGVHYLDLDANRHVNNVRYIEWMWHAIPDPFWEERWARALSVVYLDEARYGETVEVRWAETAEDGVRHEILNETGKLICAAESRWGRR